MYEALKKHVLFNEDAIYIDTKLSQGSWIVDSKTNKSYLDCFSQYGSQPLGWNHPKLLGQKNRLAEAALHKISNPDVYCPEYEQFVALFSTFFDDHDKFFFIDGGALAVENAVKCAMDYKLQKMKWDESKCNDMDIIHLQEAFHGRSGYTLSLTNNLFNNNKVKYFSKFNWTRIKNPKISSNLDQTILDETFSLKQAEEALRKSNVAAIVLEPIQGEGGDNHFRREWLVALKELSVRYDCLLIFDEVQSGFCTTGKKWAYQWHGVRPDLVAFGKKTQICGFAADSKRLNEVPLNVMNVPSRICSTWGGNIVDMVRSTIIMETIIEDGLVENARTVGKYFLDKLKELDLQNARGRGLMIAFDLKNQTERDAFLKRLKETVLALPSGQTSIRFRPHLTMSREDVDFVVDSIRKII